MSYLNLELNKAYFDDALNILKIIPDNSIDVIITSPPYAERRKKAYGGIPEEKYVEWFTPLRYRNKTCP